MKKVFNLSPYLYGVIFIIIILIFSFLYYLFPHLLNKDISFLSGIYLSVVTITTLGFGDIVPITDLGKLLVSIESILGIILLGLFLNALSRERIEKIRMRDIKNEKERYKLKQLSKLNGHKNIINPIIKNYINSIIELTNTEHGKDFNPEFKFSDMYQLYDNVYISSESFKKSEVKYYFEQLFKVNLELIDLVKSTDLRLFPLLEKESLLFIKNTYEFDYSDFIIKSKNSKINEERISDVVKREIQNFEGEPSLDTVSPLLVPYVALYLQIKNNSKQIYLILDEFKKNEYT